MEYIEQPDGSPEDQRLFERIQVQFPVNISGEAVSSDISAYGLGMISGTEPQSSADLEIWVNVPDQGQPLYARGRVVWCRPEGGKSYRMGIRLENAELMRFSRVMRLH
jgi:hypothetical protein